MYYLAVICNTDLKWHYICIKSLLSIIIVNEYVQIDYIVIIYIKSLKANWCISNNVSSYDPRYGNETQKFIMFALLILSGSHIMEYK